MTIHDADELRAVVREHYGKAATEVGSGCCGGSGGSSCGDQGSASDSFGRTLYQIGDREVLPEAALAASLGCGNPTALAELRPGEVVLELGSGGGIDVLLSARRVAPTGKAYGLDMTPEMHQLAQRNQAESGVTNAELLLGTIENVPLPDASVDVIISNCVVNLAADKGTVFREAFRVLRPGGRFAVSDVVTRGEIPAEIRQHVLAWVGCMAGALDEADYRAKLSAAGFADVDIEPTRVYRAADARESLAGMGLDVDAIAPLVDGKFFSGFIRARKPAVVVAPYCG